MGVGEGLLDMYAIRYEEREKERSLPFLESRFDGRNLITLMFDPSVSDCNCRPLPAAVLLTSRTGKNGLG